MRQPKVVRSPYKNCTAANKLTCRYHGTKFAPHPLAKQFRSAEEMFIALDEEFGPAPSRVISLPEPLERAETNAAWRELSQNVQNKLTMQQKHVLHLYSDEYGSRNISQVLRNPGTEYVFATETTSQVQDRIAVLDDMIDTHSVDSTSMTLWRGVNELGYELSGVTVGAQVQTPTYMSTSLDPSIAATFTKAEHPVILQITAKKALPVGTLLYDSEQEMLLARDKTYTVTSIEENATVQLQRDKSLTGVTVITMVEQ